jgi:tetratricopeptide (TPR) repeat protein
MRKRKLHSRAFAAILRLAPLATGVFAHAAHAEPVLDEFAAGARVSASKDCALLKVYFHFRVRYIGHFPQESGDELRISLQPIDPGSADQLRVVRREAVIADDAATAGVKAITVDLDRATGPTLRIQFTRPVSYDVGQVGGFDSIAVAVPRSDAAGACKIDNFVRSPSPRTDTTFSGSPPESTNPRPAPPPRTGKLSPADKKFIEASMDEARYAIRKKDYKGAIRLLEKVLKFPDNEFSAEALETLGEARQKAGQTAQAQADFEDYIRRYPTGDGAARVNRQLGKSTGDGAAGGASAPMLRGTLAEAEKAANGERREGLTTWSMSGGVSSFFIRDDSYNLVKDISVAPNPNADPDAHRLHQNTFLTSIDLYGTINNDQVKTKFKIAGTGENRVQPDLPNLGRYGISTAYVESTLKSIDVTARVGRQTRNTGGVIGRFDGGVVSWQASDQLRLNAVGGAANWSRFDAPFKNGRYLLGASLDVARLADGLDASVFAIQQNDKWLLDRRAIGAEFRYFKDDKSALGTIDYDVHFKKLNAAILSGSWTLPDKSVLSGTIDHRRVPYLSTWNALQGQPYFTLFDMLKLNTQDEVRRYAVDRTPTFDTAMVSYSRPLTENLQFITDATATKLSGTPPSGGVDGTMPSGKEYYLSGQLMSTNFLMPGDMYTGAFRYARLTDSNVYFVDLNSRYPWSENLRLAPRLRAGYREGRYISLKEFTILPSLLVDYMWTKNLAFEAEIGTKWIQSDTLGIRSTTKNLYVTLGLRSDFSTDGAYRCAGLLAPCSGLLFGPPSPETNVKNDNRYYADTVFNPEAPPVTSTFVIEGGVRYWRSQGNNKYDYFADATSATRVSSLHYANLGANSGELFSRVDLRGGLFRNIFLKGYIGGGKTRGGKLYDEDFPPLSLYSKTISSAAGNLGYGSIDLGYNVYTDERFRLGAFVGYHNWSERVHASGCSQVAFNPICMAPLPSSLRVITEQDRWKSLRIGAVVDVNLTERLKLNAEVAMTTISQRALDMHYFTFGNDPSKGRGGGLQAEGVLKYQLTDHFDVGLGVRWWHANTYALDAYNQLLKYHVDRFGVFGQMSYRIGWGNFPVEDVGDRQ